MNRVTIKAEETPLPPWTGEANRYILKVLEALRKDNWDLSVLLCTDPCIRALNARYRNRDEATDVLSFSLGDYFRDGGGEERFLPGDIVVSLETLAENARYFKVSEDEELRRLLIHGILHLAGMDHVTNEAAEPMLVLQEKLLAEFAGERILGETPVFPQGAGSVKPRDAVLELP
ncbi:MAG: rRNA maturation RNase YbeY [Spirochaetaceae bacterium]|jgi:probable rRNA maturation factor|nr:rRNA maturation RNase YbeY [Spirochaetaceae bacterium]